MKINRIILILGILIFVFIFSVSSFKNQSISIEEDGTIYICYSSYWGFKKEVKQIKYYNDNWYINNNKKWSILHFNNTYTPLFEQ